MFWTRAQTTSRVCAPVFRDLSSFRRFTAGPQKEDGELESSKGRLEEEAEERSKSDKFDNHLYDYKRSVVKEK